MSMSTHTRADEGVADSKNEQDDTRVDLGRPGEPGIPSGHEADTGDGEEEASDFGASSETDDSGA
jgi:hypothetical protein